MPPAHPLPFALHTLEGGRVQRRPPAVAIDLPVSAGADGQRLAAALSRVLRAAAPDIALCAAHARSDDGDDADLAGRDASRRVQLRCAARELVVAPDDGAIRIDHVRDFLPCIGAGASALDALLLSAMHPARDADAARGATLAALARTGLSRCGISTSTLTFALRHARRRRRQRVSVLVGDTGAAGASAARAQLDATAADFPDLNVDLRPAGDALRMLIAGRDSLDVIVAAPATADIVRGVMLGLCGANPLGSSAVMSAHGPACFHPAAPESGKSLEALLLAAARLLRYTGQSEPAALLADAVLSTLEDGIHTAALALLNPYTRRLDDTAFVDAVIERLGRRPTRIAPLYSHASAAPAARGPHLRIVNCD